MLLTVCVAGAVIVLAANTAAQEPSRRLASGDAAISGRVIDRQSQQPIQGVLVILDSGDVNRPVTRVMREAGNLVDESDAEGRYAFEGIAAGRYRVIATHRDYVLQTYGGSDTRLGNEGLVQVGRRQTRTGIDFALVRGGSIEGHVMNRQGQALKDATVSAMPPPGTSLRLLPLVTGTNEKGEYVLTNLPDGAYHVTATWIDNVARKAGASTSR